MIPSNAPHGPHQSFSSLGRPNSFLAATNRRKLATNMVRGVMHYRRAHRARRAVIELDEVDEPTPQWTQVTPQWTQLTMRDRRPTGPNWTKLASEWTHSCPPWPNRRAPSPTNPWWPRLRGCRSRSGPRAPSRRRSIRKKRRTKTPKSLPRQKCPTSKSLKVARSCHSKQRRRRRGRSSAKPATSSGRLRRLLVFRSRRHGCNVNGSTVAAPEAIEILRQNAHKDVESRWDS